ncbi:C-C motif chemokine 19-like [Gymnogyps californianus]|uniref:C-C motif chemokine 19-like n=1 Tax=Gymnogyps californianus TaxID=33616 RepID=UPI0021C57807|nr:C-C motif chemokine 19-like [Gymnogyps californianus]
MPPLSPGTGSLASDCCLKNSQKVIPSSWVKSYSLQGPESGCLLCAVMFTTKRNKKICTSPTDPAVQKLMQNLDKKDKKAKKDKKKGQSPRPRGKPKWQKRQWV